MHAEVAYVFRHTLLRDTVAIGARSPARRRHAGDARSYTEQVTRMGVVFGSAGIELPEA